MGKNYSNSELFTLANQIRKNTGCSKSEAYYKAKDKLENKSIFDIEAAFNGAKVRTKSGKRVKVICRTRGKILCYVYSNVGSYLDAQIKYNEDGTRWNPNYPSNEDLIIA